MSKNKFSKGIELKFGCMKSAKTAEVIKELIKWGVYFKTLLVSPKNDIRSSNGFASSRNGLKSECLSVAKLFDLEESSEFKIANVVAIDESQFFPDLKEFCVKHMHEKLFIIASLDGDYKQEKFGQAWDLIPYAKSVEKLTALCEVCKDGTPAIATIAQVELDGQVHVVKSENNTVFCSVCEYHIKHK